MAFAGNREALVVISYNYIKGPSKKALLLISRPKVPNDNKLILNINKLTLEFIEFIAIWFMNQAINNGRSSTLELQKLYINSDVFYDPQAFVLAPENVIEISKEIVKGRNYIDATKKGCLKAIDLMENALEDGTLMRDEKEDSWLNLIKEDIQSILTDESDFIDQVLPGIGTKKIILSEYGL